MDTVLHLHLCCRSVCPHSIRRRDREGDAEKGSGGDPSGFVGELAGQAYVCSEVGPHRQDGGSPPAGAVVPWSSLLMNGVLAGKLIF